jgi:hypothetical protein
MSLDFSNLDFVDAGWTQDAAEVDRVCQENSIFTISRSMAIGSQEKPQKMSFIPYLEKSFGARWYRHQGSCGSCVANGAALAVDVLAAIDHVDNGAELPKQADVCSIYWGSRVEIGKGRLGRGQGSVGVWAAQWLQQYGALEMKNYGTIDLTTYSASVCCGNHSISGVPDDLEQVARQHPVKVYAKVTNFDDLVDVIAAGYPVTVASNQGFSQQRDNDGFSQPRGTWQHQMCVIGYRLDRPGGLIANSWGEFFSGSDLCRACFYADKATINRMLAQGDSWALSDLAGWPKKALNFAGLNW